MKGVFVEGMEMPEDCVFCKLFDGKYGVCRATNKAVKFVGRPDWCPLVEFEFAGRMEEYSSEWLYPQ